MPGLLEGRPGDGPPRRPPRGLGRLLPGDAAILSARGAAELLPGSDAENRRRLRASSILREGDQVVWGEAFAALVPRVGPVRRTRE